MSNLFQINKVDLCKCSLYWYHCSDNFILGETFSPSSLSSSSHHHHHHIEFRLSCCLSQGLCNTRVSDPPVRESGNHYQAVPSTWLCLSGPQHLDYAPPLPVSRPDAGRPGFTLATRSSAAGDGHASDRIDAWSSTPSVPVPSQPPGLKHFGHLLYAQSV